MNLYQDTVIMMILSFIISYLTMPIMINRNITNNLNKIYASILMASLMGLVEIGMLLYHTNMIPYLFIIILIITSILSIYLIKTQTLIYDKQFYLSMIEHHQMAIVMADKIKQKTKDSELINLADNIMITQQKEIDFMYKKINNI